MSNRLKTSLFVGLAGACVTATFAMTSIVGQQSASAACSAKAGPLQIMMLGDSLTVGGYGDGDPFQADLSSRFRDSYRYELFRIMKGAGLAPFAFVGHNGQKVSYGTDYSGDLPTGFSETEFAHSGTGFISVEETLAQFDNYLKGPPNGHSVDPDLVVVNLGSNIKTQPVPYKELLNKIQSKLPNVVVVLATMPLVRGELTGPIPEPRQKLMTEILSTANASATDEVFGVDVNSKLRSGVTKIEAADFATGDDVHMNISGGAKFAAALAPDVIAATKVAVAKRCAAEVTGTATASTKPAGGATLSVSISSGKKATATIKPKTKKVVVKKKK
jgi:lysophospholipase L1-like esterase